MIKVIVDEILENNRLDAGIVSMQMRPRTGHSATVGL